MAWFHTSGPTATPQFTFLGSDASLAARSAGFYSREGIGDWGWGDIAPIVQTATNVGTSIYGAVSQQQGGSVSQQATAALNATAAALQQQQGGRAPSPPPPVAQWYENPIVWLGAAAAALFAFRR